jgi:hypothetical protein
MRRRKDTEDQKKFDAMAKAAGIDLFAAHMKKKAA